MFFTLSKVLGFVLQPSNLLIVLALLGLALAATRFRRAGRWLTGLAVVALAIIGLSPLSNALMLPLEERFPPWDAGRGAPDGIIVLGGAVRPEISAVRKAPQLNEAAERITALVELARRYPAARLAYTGGSSRLWSPTEMEADHALRLAESMGVARERVMIERDSRTTAENASLTKALVQPRAGERWLLVTSAAHMPRAIGAFQRAGFPVEAYPVDWNTRGEVDRFAPSSSVSGGLARFDLAMHEWFGLAAYWLSGRTSELFPAPEPTSDAR